MLSVRRVVNGLERTTAPILRLTTRCAQGSRNSTTSLSTVSLRPFLRPSSSFKAESSTYLLLPVTFGASIAGDPPCLDSSANITQCQGAPSRTMTFGVEDVELDMPV